MQKPVQSPVNGRMDKYSMEYYIAMKNYLGRTM